MSGNGRMKFADLPLKFQIQATYWAEDAWNEIYEEQGLPLVDSSAPEVQDLLEEWEFEIIEGSYEPGVRYRRLEII